jgi:polyhydroxyalkanoate synthesis regulator phasin
MLLAIVAGILAVAVAAAQTSSPTPSATGTPSSLADRFKEGLASQLGISVDELNTALTNTQNSLIDQAVADGKLTQTEANKLKSHINDDNNLFPFRGVRQHVAQNLKVAFVDEAAKVLGVDPSVITDGLKNGDSLATIANNNGMSTDDFKTKLLAQVKTDLDAKVTSGDITQDQADKLYDGLNNNIDNILNHTPGEYGRPFFGGGPHFGGRGPGFWFGGPDKDNDSTTPSPSSTDSGGAGTIF